MEQTGSNFPDKWGIKYSFAIDCKSVDGLQSRKLQLLKYFTKIPGFLFYRAYRRSTVLPFPGTFLTGLKTGSEKLEQAPVLMVGPVAFTRKE